jgi:hypothetical protein
MSERLERITAEANRLVRAGDLAAAERVLADALSGADLDPSAATPATADAAGLRARVLIALGEAEPARGWAAYAHTASRRLYGPRDGRTVRAAATLAAVLHRVGSHARAARLYREVVDQLSTMEGDAGEYTLAARADLATVLHARGDCAEARALLAQAWHDHRAAYGDGHPAGIKMLARLGAMARDCDDLDVAWRHFEHAGALCRTHLPAEHPMAIQVAALAAAPPDPGHACRADIAAISARRAAAAGPAEAGPATPDQADTGPAAPEPAAPEQADAEPAAPEPTAPEPADAEPAAPEPTAPDDRPPADAAYRQPGPAVRSRRRLPRRPTLAVAALAIVAGAAGVALAARGGADTPPPTPAPAGRSPTPGPTRSATAPAPSPPTRLALRDGHDQVTLNWVYPNGADGPVVVSGGRKGQQLRAFQTLDPGTSSYTVYGLADRSDYCFSVAIAYSTDVVLAAEPVCTARVAGQSR